MKKKKSKSIFDKINFKSAAKIILGFADIAKTKQGCSMSLVAAQKREIDAIDHFKRQQIIKKIGKSFLKILKWFCIALFMMLYSIFYFAKICISKK